MEQQIAELIVAVKALAEGQNALADKASMEAFMWAHLCLVREES